MLDVTVNDYNENLVYLSDVWLRLVIYDFPCVSLLSTCQDFVDCCNNCSTLIKSFIVFAIKSQVVYRVLENSDFLLSFVFLVADHSCVNYFRVSVFGERFVSSRPSSASVSISSWSRNFGMNVSSRLILANALVSSRSPALTSRAQPCGGPMMDPWKNS